MIAQLLTLLSLELQAARGSLLQLVLDRAFQRLELLLVSSAHLAHLLFLRTSDINITNVEIQAYLWISKTSFIQLHNAAKDDMHQQW